MTCEVLVADPPWQFDLGKSSNPGKFRGTVDQHYKALTIDDICLFPIPLMAKDATLYLWRVAALQRQALDVIRSWDFELKAELVWRKLTKNGKRHMGMGRQVRMEHEVCLIATRGSPKVLDKGVRSVFDADEPSIFEAKVGRHSEKPPEFFEILERLHGPPSPRTHTELFARAERPGWDCYGDELFCAHPEKPTAVENL